MNNVILISRITMQYVILSAVICNTDFYAKFYTGFSVLYALCHSEHSGFHAECKTDFYALCQRFLCFMSHRFFPIFMQLCQAYFSVLYALCQTDFSVLYALCQTDFSVLDALCQTDFSVLYALCQTDFSVLDALCHAEYSGFHAE